MKRVIGIIALISLLSGCASYDYPSKVELGSPMITASGESLAGDPYVIPEAFSGQNTLLILGYIHKSQFDIDRWLIG